jgi:hypothetical protein
LLGLAIDAVLLIVPTLATIVAAAALSLYLTDRASFDAVQHIGRLHHRNRAVAYEEARQMARLLVRLEARGVPPAMAAAVEEGDLNRAATILRGYEVGFSIRMDESSEAPLLPKTLFVPVERLIPSPTRAVLLLGVPALYFAGFTRSRRRATPGKRLAGIYVQRLDGERLTWLEALERFVGYVHIPATAFLSVLDLWRDPNRRLPHDRTVHTAVLRQQPARRAATSQATVAAGDEQPGPPASTADTGATGGKPSGQ